MVGLNRIKIPDPVRIPLVKRGAEGQNRGSVSGYQERAAVKYDYRIDCIAVVHPVCYWIICQCVAGPVKDVILSGNLPCMPVSQLKTKLPRQVVCGTRNGHMVNYQQQGAAFEHPLAYIPYFLFREGGPGRICPVADIPVMKGIANDKYPAAGQHLF